MIEKKREIFIKLENMKEIVDVMSEIREKEDKLKELFYAVDKINIDEGKLVENWGNYAEEVLQRLDHITM